MELSGKYKQYLGNSMRKQLLNIEFSVIYMPLGNVFYKMLVINQERYQGQNEFASIKRGD